MLVLFRFKNFGPFREEAILDMRAVKAYKEHPYNLISETEENDFLKVVSIYGANASGKSNFIDAYSTFQRIARFSFQENNKDTKETFGHVNTWWVFSEVATNLDYNIFMAETDAIGYKRSKRGERLMPNELYRTNNAEEILIDDGNETTILDAMRKIVWD